MDPMIKKLRILMRLELTLARINAQRMAHKIVYGVFTVALLIIALVMVNVGAYQLLAESFGSAASAFLVALGNVVLAVIPVLLSKGLKPGPEEAAVREIRELALSEIAAEAQDVQEGFSHLADDVKKIRSGLSAFNGGGLDAGLMSLGPVLGFLIDLLKRKKP